MREADQARSWLGLNVLVVSPTPTHPRDHGNRKRIYEICAGLKARGARVEFLHYPSEFDWRHHWPRHHESQMRAAWDDYHLVAPSRDLHTASQGPDHGVDDWADPDLQHFIAWACRVRAYDAVLVNFTWMSFCFEAVPKGIFKICDTHDVFGGRRALLEANGIAPEFFHTTEAEEARGLARADLVWAIKPSEQRYFETVLGLPQGLTMLYAEPDLEIAARPVGGQAWLRAGFIGAKNNINRRNVEEFLTEALPALERAAAPVKIVIGGGVADDFEGRSHPHLDVLGRVAEVEDFYASVDIVIAPMRFSTGLKIKVFEALAAGKPLVAHAHAMEGYPSQEPLHQLESFSAMAQALVRLSQAPASLAPLAERSRAVRDQVRQGVSASFDETRRLMRESWRGTICVVAPAEAIDPSTLLHTHLLQALDYLRSVAPLALYAQGPRVGPMNFAFLPRLGLRPQVFAAPELAATGDAAAREICTPMGLLDLLQTRGFARAYVMADCRDELAISTAGLRQVVVRYDALEIAGASAEGLIESLRGRVDLTLVSAEMWLLRHWRDEAGVSAAICAPWRARGAVESPCNPPGASLLVLAQGRDAWVDELLILATRLGWRGEALDMTDGAARPALRRTTLLEGRALVVDLTERDALADAIGEAAAWLGVPRLKLQRGALAWGQHSLPTPLLPTSLARLFRSVADCATKPGALEAMRKLAAAEAATRYGGEVGWAELGRIYGAGLY